MFLYNSCKEISIIKLFQYTKNPPAGSWASAPIGIINAGGLRTDIGAGSEYTFQKNRKNFKLISLISRYYVLRLGNSATIWQYCRHWRHSRKIFEGNV